MVLGYVITPVGLRVEFLWNDALYSTNTHCDVLDVITELTIPPKEGCSEKTASELYPLKEVAPLNTCQIFLPMRGCPVENIW